jgi:putative tryptophan/tyrosine transport system substrate-binding protein
VIDRRAFLAILGLGAFGRPRAVRAQPAGKVWRIGVLASAPADSPLLQAFRQGLREVGYVEGQNVLIEYRFAAGKNDLLPGLAADLVAAKVDLILTDGNAAVHAAKNATRTIPIVMGTSGDPLSSGAVKSLSRPGGNVTGLTLLGLDLAGKKLELIRTAVPKVKAVAMLVNPTNPQASPLQKATEGAARSLALRFVPCAAASPADLEKAFEAAAKEHADGMITMPDAMFWNFRQRLVTLAAARRLPTIFAEREFVEAGGLMSYGPSVANNFRRAAIYVDKIFKGTKPEDLPVEQPTSVELVINLKTAKALGLMLPQSLVTRADELIR